MSPRVTGCLLPPAVKAKKKLRRPILRAKCLGFPGEGSGVAASYVGVLRWGASVGLVYHPLSHVADGVGGGGGVATALAKGCSQELFQ